MIAHRLETTKKVQRPGPVFTARVYFCSYFHWHKGKVHIFEQSCLVAEMLSTQC